ncbi:Glutamine synthetase [Archaeoglobus sulfaticallidus PM70-1]|uniref:Glutamine synthetase n=1 Tax=Archaeoglobus sulfaticallidus PM70-1 TaxID=387631 RepID=N0B9D2_9EURY|nr:glutamine synthetase family protein [Archaeoglobus sulfaticallidus]AGK60219.1 Glutamine synthetase [Archaeoglobus sulfaticallidus PM70-1]
MELDEILKLIEEKGIEYIRYLYIDNDGVVRGKMGNAKNAKSDLVSGVTYVSCMQSAFGALDLLTPNSIYGCVGELKHIPDLNTFRIVPYAEKTAMVIGDFYTRDMKIFEADPRPILKQKLSELDFEIKSAFETEFYLFDSNSKPYDDALCFATPAMNASNEFAIRVKEYLEMQDVFVEHFYPEYGPGQYEIAVKPACGITSADNQIILRETVRGVAQGLGLTASFMPKPSNELPGSGVHIHISLWKDGENLFADGSDLSDLAYHFIGGILKHMKALLAFTASTVNSYKRLLPHNWASAYACYGFENREAAIRIPLPIHKKEKETLHLEIKPVDGCNNPYLVLGSIIAAGVDGIKNKIDPGDPVDKDPADMSEAERDRYGVERFPQNLGEAIAELEKDRMFEEFWGRTLYEEYLKTKKFEWEAFCQHVTDWEINKYLKAF